MSKLVTEMPTICRVYVKKRIPIKAKQMKESFRVETLEGIMYGSPGDYLIRGIRGELYPCARDIFEESYEEYSIECDGASYDEDLSGAKKNAEGFLRTWCNYKAKEEDITHET